MSHRMLQGSRSGGTAALSVRLVHIYFAPVLVYTLYIPGQLTVRWYSLVLVYARTGFQTVVGIQRINIYPIPLGS